MSNEKVPSLDFFDDGAPRSRIFPTKVLDRFSTLQMKKSDCGAAVCSSHWFESLLVRCGHELWIGDAGAIARQEGRKQKHDRRAAALILKLMVENRFPKIWVPTVAERDLRQLLMHRHHLVRMRTRVKNQLQHIAMNQGVQKKYKLWTQAGLKVLRELELEPWTRQRRNTLLEMLEELEQKIRPLEQAVEQEAEARPAAQLLATHPGVGPVIAFGHGVDHGRGEAVR